MNARIEGFRAIAEAAADAARTAILPHYRALKGDTAPDYKADTSPVTIADKHAELAIRSVLREALPEHGIQGEEFGAEKPDAPWQWVIDPIDGTIAFITGRPMFGTLIALLYENRPVLGLIDQAVTQDRFVGTDGGAATLNGKRCQTRACDGLRHAWFASTAPEHFSAEQAPLVDRIRSHCALSVWGGDCMNYALLAAGHGDLVIESGLALHDFAALAPIVTAAGGVMTDWTGAALTTASDGRVIAAGDPRCHAAALAILTGG